MKYTILLISLFVANFTYSSTSDVIQNDTTITNLNYDKLLAEKLGGDDYGMKIFYLVILKTGTNNTTDETIINDSFSTKRIKYVEENIAAANITLSQENIDLLESIIPLGTDTGDRYANMSGVNL
jgi:hypothetical protein